MRSLPISIQSSGLLARCAGRARARPWPPEGRLSVAGSAPDSRVRGSPAQRCRRVRGRSFGNWTGAGPRSRIQVAVAAHPSARSAPARSLQSCAGAGGGRRRRFTFLEGGERAAGQREQGGEGEWAKHGAKPNPWRAQGNPASAGGASVTPVPNSLIRGWLAGAGWALGTRFEQRADLNAGSPRAVAVRGGFVAAEVVHPAVLE